MPDDPTTSHGRRQLEERQRSWNSKWEMFRPADGVERSAIFHIDLPTLILSAIVGYPVGVAAAIALTGQPGLGGFLGIFPVMLIFGFFRRRIQLWGTRGEQAATRMATAARSPSRILMTYTVFGTVVMGLLGVWFAKSQGDIALATGGVRFGGLGSVAGFVVGLIAALRSRRQR